MAAAARQRLLNEYKGLSKEKWVKIEMDEDSIFKWNISLIVINPDSSFDGAYLKAEMGFTDKYPYAPPTFKFLQQIYHPNIYSDGRVCISILHAAGDDEQSGELACERWSSIQSVESVLRSVLLLLDNPEITSPANVDASVMYRDDRAAYNQKAAETVNLSKKSTPEGFIIPRTIIELPQHQTDDDDDFWNQSDEQEDFGASVSSGDDNFDFDLDNEENDGEYEQASVDNHIMKQEDW